MAARRSRASSQWLCSTIVERWNAPASCTQPSAATRRSRHFLRTWYRRAHWAWLAGTAGWMLWTNLPPTDQELVRRMVEYEANRFTSYAVPYYMNRAGTIISPGDTKSEENAWNAELLHLAACMMPVHSNAPLWWSKAIEMTLSTYARPSDVNRTNVYHGRTLASWLNGSNANEDSTVINHNIVHPDYLAAGLS